MVVQFLLGFVMTAITVAFGATAIVIGAEPLRRNKGRLLSGDGNHIVQHIVTLTLVATALVTGMLLIMLLWALLLIALGIFPGLEPALYFSMISFTTLGFGDVLLPDQWRLLAGFIAVNGFLLFGINSAFIFEVLLLLREPFGSRDEF